MSYAPDERGKLARNGQEYLDLLRSDANWIVRAPDDLVQFRANGGALAKLPEEEFRAFLEGLKFKANGVCGGNSEPLLGLKVSEAYDVFEGFGVDRGYAAQSLGRACVNNKCTSTIDGFCFSSICSIHVKGEEEGEG
jgi:hypothetical protein